MAGLKEVGVRLSLKADGLKKGLGQAVGAAKAAGTAMGNGISSGLESATKGGIGALRRGFKEAEGLARRSGAAIGKGLSSGMESAAKGGVGALKSSLGGLKSSIAQLAAPVTGLGLVGLATQGVMTAGSFRKLAFEMRLAGDAGADWRTIMEQAQAVSKKTGQSTGDLAEAMSGLLQETGNPEFVKASLEDIATAATGAHQPLSQMAAVAGTLNEKFGVSSKELPEALASAVSLANKGGVSFEDLAQRLGEVGAIAKVSGLQGQEGFESIVGMLNVADNSGRKFKTNINALAGILKDLGTDSSRVKIAAQLGLDPRKLKGDSEKAISEIIKKTGGNKQKLAAVFENEAQLTFLTDLGKTYADAFAATEGDVKTKTKAGTDALTEAMSAAGKSSITYADLQKEAASEMQTAEAKAKVAMETLVQKFTEPKVLGAIDQLAEHLPTLAKAAADAIEFFGKSPVKGAALVGGAIVAKGAAGEVVGSAGKSIWSSLFGGGGGAAGGAAAGAGTGVAGAGGGAAAAGAGLGAASIAGILTAAVGSTVGQEAVRRTAAGEDVPGGGLAAAGLTLGYGALNPLGFAASGALGLAQRADQGGSRTTLRRWFGADDGASDAGGVRFISPEPGGQMAKAGGAAAPAAAAPVVQLAPESLAPLTEALRQSQGRGTVDVLGRRTLDVRVTNAREIADSGGIPQPKPAFGG